MTEPNECMAFFKLNSNKPDLVKLLQKSPAAEAWEKLTASEHSPGPVNDEETLCRQIFSPIHVDADTQQLKPTAFDDASNKGLSTDRLAFCDLEAVKTTGVRRAEESNQGLSADKQRALHSVALINTRDIRLITYDIKRAFGVYDTGLPHNQFHADVCQLAIGKQAGRSVRSKLIDLAKVEIILHSA